jgi:c(7)-type cytochrome triheme protein
MANHGKDVYMRMIPPILAILALVMFMGSAMAVPAGKTVTFDNPMGKVVFDGKVHAAQGLKCTACHTKIFKMKKGADKMTMADINAGKFCGACHNGTQAFKANDPANCKKCHMK